MGPRLGPQWDRDISELEEEFDQWRKDKRDELRGLGFRDDILLESKKPEFKVAKLFMAFLCFLILGFLALMVYFMIVTLPDNAAKEFEKTVQQYEEKIDPKAEVEPKESEPEGQSL